MTHLLLRALLIWGVATVAMAASSDDLFTLKLRLSEAQSPRSVDGLLREAVGIELQRLTGEAHIEPALLHYFSKRPRRWIQRYSFSPYRQEGVVIGQWLHLVFDKPQLLQAMEAQGLIYWPVQMRPRLLITGYWTLQGTQTPLDPALAREHPDFDLVYAAYLLGLHVSLPVLDDWGARRPVLMEEDVAEFCQRYGVDGVLRLYFEDQFINGARRVRLYWESFLPGWEEHLTGTLQDVAPTAVFRQLLLSRIPDWRAPFQQSANETGEAVLVLKTTVPEALAQLEAALKHAAPLVRSVQLVEARRGEGRYAITWRGSWQTLQTLLAQISSIRIVDANDTTGTVVLEAVP